MDKDKAEEHSASRECLSKKFQCGTCTMDYKNASLLQRHKCGGKPKYERFYCNNFNNTVNTMKIAMVMMMILIRNKSFFSGFKTLTSLFYVFGTYLFCEIDTVLTRGTCKSNP